MASESAAKGSLRRALPDRPSVAREISARRAASGGRRRRREVEGGEKSSSRSDRGSSAEAEDEGEGEGGEDEATSTPRTTRALESSAMEAASME